MIINDCVLDLKRYWSPYGSAEPPAGWADISPYHADAVDGAGAAAPAWEQLLSGLWVKDLDGTNDFMTIPAPRPTLPLAFEFWICPNTSTPVGLFDTGPRLALTLRQYVAGSVDWQPNNPQVVLGLAALTWQHVVFAYYHGVNNGIAYFLNGALISTTEGAALSDFTWSDPIRIGDINSGALFYCGKIGKIKIHNYRPVADQVNGWFASERHWFDGA